MKKMLCAILTLCMVFAMLPLGVIAAEPASAPESFSVTGTLENTLHVNHESLVLNADDDIEYTSSIYTLGDQLRQAMAARQEQIYLYYYTTEYSNEDLEAAANEIFYYSLKITDEPTEGDYLYWSLAQINAGVDYYLEGGEAYVTYVFEPVYITNAAQEAELTEEVNRILDELDVYTTNNLAKVQAVYDYICANVSYDGPYTDETPFYKFSAYAAAVEGSATSYGIAMLFHRLVMELDVDGRMVCGELDGVDHCWNIVNVDDFYYNVDASLDAGNSEHHWFLLSDEGLSGHLRYADYATEDFYNAYPMDSLDYAEDEIIQKSGTFGENITWTLGHRGTVTLSGSGEMFEFEDSASTPLYNIRDQINAIIVEDGITNVSGFAFYDCTPNRIYLSKDITSIGYSAFKHCDQLRDLVIPEGVTYIGKYAFENCNQLAEIVMPANLSSIAEGAFQTCTMLKEISIPASVTKIEDYAFQESGLVSVALPEGLEEIGVQSFYESALKEVTIPAGVSSIGNSAFGQCSQLTQILVESSNSAYTSIDGVLYNADVTSIICCPQGKIGVWEIPDTVTQIGGYMAELTKNLTELITGDGVQSIGTYAFDRSGIRKAVFGHSVSSISGFAFRICSNLTEIYFTGNAPELDTYAFYDVVANVYYPSKDETWTEDVFANYGGTLTWIPYCGDDHTVVVRDAADAFCEADGYTGDEYCADCGQLITQGTVIPALGHSYEAVTVEPTCTEQGYTTYTCATCGEIEVADYVDAPGHTYDDGVINSEPTCTEEGVKTITCTVCGDAYTEAIPALGHTRNEGVVTQEATCTVPGVMTYVCTVCEVEFTEEIPVIDHDFVDGFCSVCGQQQLAAPTILSCYSKLQDSVKVTWTTDENADGYELYRTTTPDDADSWTRVKTINDGSTDRYTNQGLEVGTTYYYKVRAFVTDVNGERMYSEFSNVDYMPAAVVFDGPYSNATFRIRLRWNEIDGAHGYQIWRQNADGSWNIVKTLGDKGNELTNNQGATTAYSNTGLTAGENYTYKMRAFMITEDGRKVFGAYSDEYTVAVMPETPVVTGTSPKATRAQLSWDALNGADGYQIWMAEAEDGEYKIVKSVTDGSTSYTKYDLTSGKTYYFKVRAYTEVEGKKTFGAYSEIVSVDVQ